MSQKIDITLNVNGRDYDVRVEPRRTLADTLRDECGLTGTNSGCEHGICGSCTVLCDGEPVRACLMFAVQAQGRQLRTVEGLARSVDGVEQLHPLQQAFIDHQQTPHFKKLVLEGALPLLERRERHAYSVIV